MENGTIWKSTHDGYGRVAIVQHWTSAVLILGLLGAGFAAANAADPAVKVSILRLHAPLGVAVLVATLVRLAWWAFLDRKPAPPAGLPGWQALLARGVHGGLMIATIGLALSGMALFVFSGAGPIVFGGEGRALPDFWAYPPRYAHAAFALLAVVLVALHVAAAFYHQLVLKDRLLARMGVGR